MNHTVRYESHIWTFEEEYYYSAKILLDQFQKFCVKNSAKSRR